MTPLDRPVPNEAQIVTAYTDGQVTLRSNRSKIGYHEAADLSGYQGVEPGDFVVHGLDILRGSVGVSDSRGAISNVCTVCRPNLNIDARYIAYAIRLQAQSGYTRALARGIREGGADFRRWDTLAALPVPAPPFELQRRISDFLDDQVARTDNIIAARKKQSRILEESQAEVAWRALKGSSVLGPRRESRIRWLGDAPSDWPTATVHTGFEVVLGKMLDERRMTGLHPLPYLRNTNVQWDVVATDDLKVMDIDSSEYERFTVRRGDLLICEGGQPGRSAIWNGSISPIGFQKALHRARGRNNNDVRWLQVFLRVAVAMSVFSIEFGQATIGHLTGEQLKSLRLPMPRPSVQRLLADGVAAELKALTDAQELLGMSVARLEELKRSLITAAVTGEFDVSTADGSQVPV